MLNLTATLGKLDVEKLEAGKLAIEYPIGIFFYSTFFTSVWVWLYALSGVLLKVLYSVKLGMGLSSRIFEVETAPLRSLGMVSNLIITFLFAFGALLKLLLWTID